MDSFKGSASSLEIASYVQAGILRVRPDAEVKILPVADGGEGTVEALVSGLLGRYETIQVTGPLGKPVLARYGMLPGNHAVLEMAAASGLTLISEEEHDPFITSTFGTGELLLAALNQGCKQVFIGLGGSATNDGGMGLAKALGVSFLDETGQEVEPGAAGLAKLHSIHLACLDKRIHEVEITALTDVANPLYGSDGAAYTFGLQKGAKAEELEKLDKALWHLAEIVKHKTGSDFSEVPGAGAAGGLGFGLLSFCGARIQPGIETILNLLSVDQLMQTVDCVITGEGRLDDQSLRGKAPVGIATRAKKFRLPVIAIVGSLNMEPDKATRAGFNLVLELMQKPMSLKEAIKDTPRLARLAGENAIKAFLSGQVEDNLPSDDQTLLSSPKQMFKA
jgi:glycerate kinase